MISDCLPGLSIKYLLPKFRLKKSPGILSHLNRPLEIPDMLADETLFLIYRKHSKIPVKNGCGISQAREGLLEGNRCSECR